MEEYRDAGYLSDAFVNYLALLGWSLDGETTIIPRDVLASKFSLDRISKNPATFDPKKLDWVNAEYINGMSDAQFADEIMVPELHEAGLIEGNVEYGEDWIDALAAIVKPRTKMPADAVTVAAPSSLRPRRSSMTRSPSTRAWSRRAWVPFWMPPRRARGRGRVDGCQH